MDTDGLNRSQLTTAPGADSWPSVTPDGRVVVFTSERDGGRALWRMEIDGGRQQKLVPANVRVRPMLSADGKEVYYGDQKTRQNFRVSIDGGTPTPLPDVLASGGAAGVTLPEGFHEAAPSPDGRQIAGHYIARDQRGERMAVITPGRADGVVLMKTVPVPAQWSPDGKSLLYIDTRRGISNLWRHPLGGGAAVAGHEVHQRPDLPVCARRRSRAAGPSCEGTSAATWCWCRSGSRARLARSAEGARPAAPRRGSRLRREGGCSPTLSTPGRQARTSVRRIGSR